MIILYAEKVFEKNHNTLMIKTLRELGKKENIFNLIGDIYKNLKLTSHSEIKAYSKIR